MSTSTLARTASPEPADHTADQRRSRWALLVEVLAVVPVALVGLEVFHAPKLQFIDYWYTLLRFTRPDGSTDALRLLNLSNEHPVLLPSIAYWVDAHLFHGDNRALGVLVILVAAATVLAFRAALPRTLNPFLRAGLVVAASGMVFSLHSLWNYTRAMSGIAWLTANLLVALALLLGARGKWLPAWLCAVLASVTYGTGFAVWPAFALVAALRRERRWRWIAPLVVGVVIFFVWSLFRPEAPPGPVPAHDVGSIGYNFLILVGHLWTSTSAGLAAVIGGAMLAAYVVFATTSFAREGSLAFWWALALYGFIGTGMIAVARVDTGQQFGLNSRYASLSMLLSLPLIVMIALAATRAYRSQGHRFAVGAVALGVVAFLLGSPTAVFERGFPHKEQELQAIAIRGGFANIFSRLPDANWLVPPLRALHHYPFSDDFTLGCGGPEFGSRLDPSKMQPLGVPSGNKKPVGAVGQLEQFEQAPPGGRISGWAYDAADPIRCVLITDGSGKVVGGGVTHLTRTDVLMRYFGITPDVGFEAVGPIDKASRIVFVQRSGAMRWVKAGAAPTRLDGLRAPEGEDTSGD